METHTLKTWPEFFSLVIKGYKQFEIRKNDRDYQVGDVLHLREWQGGEYTGRDAHYRVTYILTRCPGLMPGYCLLGIEGPWGMK